ncbi:ABC transporter substrate-binding protein [Rhizobium binxianense]
MTSMMNMTRRQLHKSMLAGAALLMAPRVVRAQEVFTIAQPDDLQPTNLIPGRANNFSWVRNVFESLAYLDPKSFQPVPGLATEWTLASDGLSMELKLAEATFHSGRPFTAQDAIYSIQVAADPKSASQVGFIAKEFSKVEAPDDHTLALTFKRPLPNIFEFFERTPIVDKETYDARADGKRLIGTGPYRFVNWVPGASARLERFESYRIKNDNAIAVIEIAPITDPTAMISALRSGRAQMAVGMQPRDMIEFQGNPMFQIISAGGAFYPFGVRVDNKPFDQKALRQAIAYAVDRERINQQVFDSTGLATPLFWFPGSPGYTDALATQYDYDPDKARQLVKDAGAAGAALTIAAHALPQTRSIFEILQNNLREIGLSIEGNIMDVQAYGKGQIAGELGPAFIQFHSMVGLSAATIIDAAPSLRKGNPAHFWTDEYAALQDAVRTAVKPDATASAVENLTTYLNDEAFALNTVQAPALTVTMSGVENISFGLDGYFRFADAVRS